MSRFLQASDIEAIRALLSAERLATFRDLTASGEDEDAIELHQASMSLGVAIMGVTGLIEVSLRNAVCHAMNEAYGMQSWLRTPPQNTFRWAEQESRSIRTAFSQAQRAAYSKMSGREKVSLDVAAFPEGVPKNLSRPSQVRRRQKFIEVSDGQVIAHLTIYFWKRLFSQDYERTLWRQSLKSVFPDKRVMRADVATHLEVIYETRNRVAHHEPVYDTRLDKIIGSIDFITRQLGCRTPSFENPFAKLTLPQRDILHGQVAIFRSTFDRLTLKAEAE